MGLFSKDFNNDFKKTMMGNDIRELVAAKIAGQGNQVDVGSVLPDIFYKILDLVDYVSGRIPTVPTALQTLAALTCASEAETITSATDLTKDEAAEALGIIADNLDGLFAGSFLRFSYSGTVLGVDFITPDSVSLGAGAIVIGLADGVYSITVA